MAFILILLVILNSNYWLDFTPILYIYDSKFHIICAVSFIYRIWVLIVFPSNTIKEIFFYPRTMASSHRHRHRQRLSFLFFSWFPNFPQVWPLVRIAASIGNYLPSLRIVAIYIQGDPLSPTTLNVVVDNVCKTVGMLCHLCHVVRTFWCRRRRLGPMLGRKLAGGGGGGRRQGGRLKQEGRQWLRSIVLRALIS